MFVLYCGLCNGIGQWVRLVLGCVHQVIVGIVINAHFGGSVRQFPLRLWAPCLLDSSHVPLVLASNLPFLVPKAKNPEAL